MNKNFFKAVCEIISEIVDDVDLTTKTKLRDLCDSITMAEIVIAIEEEFEISIPDDNFENVITIKDLADLVEELV